MIGIDQYTKFLCHFDGTNNSTSFLDSSGQMNIISANGDAKMSTAQAKFGLTSVSLDGTGDYLTITDSPSFDFSSGYATLEFWVYFNVFPSGSGVEQTLYYQKTDSSNFFRVYFDGTAGIQGIRIHSSSINRFQAAGAPTWSTGVWYHVAVVCNNNVWTIYRDGVSVGLSGGNGSVANYTGSVLIGADNDSTPNHFFNGYIDEVRISNTVRYTANFTAPTSPYLPHVDSAAGVDSYTKAMLHFDKISGGQANAIQFVGNAKLSTTQKQFGISSLLLDGSGDYLRLTANSDFAFGTGDFTIDFWTKFNSISASDTCFIYSGTSSPNFYEFGYSTTKLYFTSNASTVQVTWTPNTNTWYHVALVRNGSNLYFFVNGSQIGSTQTNSTNLNYYHSLLIGSGNAPQEMNGYMDELRISKGIARWTSPFILSTIQYTSDQYTSLLLHFDGANDATSTDDASAGDESSVYRENTNKIVTYKGGAKTSSTQTKFGKALSLNSSTDANTVLLIHANGESGDTSIADHSSSNKTITAVGNAQLGTQARFGKTSISLDGTGDALSIPSSSDWNFGSGDFTIDLWVKFNSVSTGTNQQFWNYQIDGSNQLRFLYNDNTDKLMFLWYNVTQYDLFVEQTWNPSINTWYHVAVVRNGTSFKLFVDGTQLGSDTISSVTLPNYSSSTAYIGGQVADNIQYVNGYIDEFRVSKGIARWTSNFTPSTEPYDSQRGDWLSLPSSSDFAVGNGEFTIEGWFYPLDVATNQYLWCVGSTSPDDNMRITIAQSVSGDLSFLCDVAGVTQIYLRSAGGVLVANQWQHIAIVRSETNYFLFINGVATPLSVINGSTANTLITASRQLTVGSYITGSGGFKGYIDEFRFSKGIARWTDTFTPPVSAYSGIADYSGGIDANTKLLVSGDRLTGTTVKSASFSGDAKISTVHSKFGGASLALDGSGDFISFADSPDWDLVTTTTQDYTIDFWVRHNATGSIYYIVQNDGTNAYELGRGANNKVYLNIAGGGGGSDFVETSSTITDNEWHHLAFIKTGGASSYKWGIYIDGVQDAYLNITRLPNIPAVLWIGRGFSGGYLNGNMDEIRINKNNAFRANPTSTNTDRINVPTREHIADLNTVLLLHFNDANNSISTGDSSGGDESSIFEFNTNKIMSVNGSATISATDYKFGRSSLRNPGGSGNYYSIPDHADWDVMGSLSDNWTIDFWTKTDSASGTEGFLSQTDDTNNYWTFRRLGSTIYFRLFTSGTSRITLYGTLGDTNWHHIALVKVASAIGLYIDGVQVAHDTLTVTGTFSSQLQIMAQNGEGYRLTGNMDEVRIQKSNIFSVTPSYALTSTFTVPSSAYTRVANTEGGIDTYTKLLLHSDKTNEVYLHPYAQFTLNDNAANTTVLNNGSGGQSGTATTNTNNLTAVGKINNAFNFAASYRVDISSFGSVVKNDTQGTIAFWMKSSTTGTMFSFGASAADSHFVVYISGTKLAVLQQYNNNAIIYSAVGTATINDGKWHHVAATQDTTGMKLYVDGALEVLTVSTGTSTVWLAAANTGGQINSYILGGTNSFGTGNTFFNGFIDDCRYYSGTALSLRQIQEIYNSGNGTEGFISPKNQISGIHPYIQYSMNDNAANTTVINSGYSSQSGTASTNTSSLTTTGKLNSSLGFNGSSQYINIDNIVSGLTSDNTGSIAMWLYPDSTGGNGDVFSIAKTTESGVSTMVQVSYYSGSNQLFLFVRQSGTSHVNMEYVGLTPDTWNHIVITQDATAPKLYVNGSLVSWTSNTGSNNTAWFNDLTGLDNGRLGCSNRQSLGNIGFYKGRIDDFRYYSNTVLTTTQISELYNSGNGTESFYSPNDIVFIGNASISTSQKKFGTSSLALDGSGDRITISDSSDWHLDKYNFTIEWWVRYNSVSGTPGYISQTQSSGFDTNNHWYIRKGGFFARSGGTFIADYSWSDDATTGTWYHYALVRNGDSIAVYRNGIALNLTVGTAIAASAMPNLTGLLQIGDGSDIGDPLNGYMDEIRVSKGIARYTSNFSVATKEFSSDEFTALLLHFNDSNGATSTANSAGGDDCSLVTGVNNKVVSFYGNAKLTSLQHRFGNRSMSFDGVSSYITVPHTSDFDFGTGDFTIDGWVRFTSASQYTFLWNLFVNSDNQFQCYIDPLSSDNAPVFYVKTNGTVQAWYYVTTISFNQNQWYHIAYVRNGSTFKIFVNGVSQTLTTMQAIGSNNITVPGGANYYHGFNGEPYSATKFLNGYIEEFRISKGIARWTSDFTPPTNAYTNVPVVITRRPSAQGIIVV